MTPPAAPLRRPGGIAALVCAATYVFGFVMILGPLAEVGFGMPGADSGAISGFIAENPALMSVWYLSIYVLNGLALALLVLALEERIAPRRTGLAKVVRATGLIWATLVIGAGMAANVGVSVVAGLQASDPAAAALRWDMVELIEIGIGGGNEILGGLLALLTGWAALSAKVLPRPLGALGIAIGVAGLLTVIPALQPIAAPVFGLGYIAWFVWTGIVLLSSPASA